MANIFQFVHQRKASFHIIQKEEGTKERGAHNKKGKTSWTATQWMELCFSHKIQVLSNLSLESGLATGQLRQ